MAAAPFYCTRYRVQQRNEAGEQQERGKRRNSKSNALRLDKIVLNKEKKIKEGSHSRLEAAVTAEHMQLRFVSSCPLETHQRPHHPWHPSPSNMLYILLQSPILSHLHDSHQIILRYVYMASLNTASPLRLRSRELCHHQNHPSLTCSRTVP